MGIFGVASKAAKGKLGEEAKTKMHRKYVWNDFSIGIEKAKLHILTPTNLGNGKDTTIVSIAELGLEHLHTLFVQLNPGEFKFEYVTQPSLTGNSNLFLKAGGNGSMPPTTFSKGHVESTFTLPLIYDIYDEYMALTGNESYPALGDFSLYDDTATSLPMLIQDVTTNICFGQFVWGKIEKFGVLSKIDVSYTAFSRWGDPLKATANLEMQEWILAPSEKLPINEVPSPSEGATIAKNVASGAANIFR